MAAGGKNNPNNPFYPPRKESVLKEIGVTIGVVLVCLLLVGVIVKNFNFFAIEQRKNNEEQEAYYEGDSEYPVTDEYVEEDMYVEEGTLEEDIILSEEPVEKNAILLSGNPEESMMAYTYIPVVSANATSTIVQNDVVNTAIVAFDGLDETSWQEGVNGYGVGEGMVGYFSDPFEMKYIGFKLGNWKSDKYYFGNAKPKTLTVTLGDFSQQITFTGERRVEWVKIEGTVVADSIQITINDIYPGTDWEDTCIAEISLYGI